MSTSLASLLRERAVEVGNYGGVPTAARFGEAAAEWRALTEASAVLDLSRRRTILVRGEEREQFLQGQLTQNVLSMPCGAGRPALLLNAQGRVQSMLTIYSRSDLFEIHVDADLLEPTRARLEQFLIADDVEMEGTDAGERIGVAGPRALAVLEVASGMDLRGLTGWSSTDARIGAIDVRLRARDDLRVPFVEVEPCDDAVAVWEALCAVGAQPVGTQAFEMVRIESGTARYGVDVDDTRIAMEARLEWAIHFSKGCYVGQEVIERAVSRGRLNRELCLLATTTDVRSGDRVEGGSEKDKVTSICRSPRLGHICLAYVVRERAVTGSPVRIARDGEWVDGRVLEWPRLRHLAGR